MDHPKDIRLSHTLRPGDMGALVSLHGRLYAREQGFDGTFEAYVAAPLAECVLHPSPRQRFWLLHRDDELLGALALLEASREEGQLRWFLLHPDLRGQGWGRRLLGDAIAHGRTAGFRNLFLWTVDTLATARKVYLAAGFTLTEELSHVLWGRRVNEQRYDLPLTTPEVSEGA